MAEFGFKRGTVIAIDSYESLGLLACKATEGAPFIPKLPAL